MKKKEKVSTEDLKISKKKETKAKKKNTWCKFRHKVVRRTFIAFFKPFSYLKYNIKVEKFKEQGDRAYLILFNHQTAFDQFFVGIAFKRPVYYVASEDLFSNGLSSALIKYLVAPIPIKKQTTDVRAVINCMKVAKEGGTIAIAPEGNRTYSGKTEYMKDTIAQLAKALKLPIALYRIEGGYGVHPRWSDVIRRGKMKGYVSRVIEPEDYLAMTDAELMAQIQEGLYVNEACVSGRFKHKKSAEYLERAAYICPKCQIGNLYSNGEYIDCLKCGLRVKYNDTKELSSRDSEFNFKFFNEWYEYQMDYVRGMDTEALLGKRLFVDFESLYEVAVYKFKKRISDCAKISLYIDRMTIEYDGNFIDVPFDKVSTVTVLGKNKLNIYLGDKLYQIKGDERFNAIKYVNLCYRFKAEKEGNLNGNAFLGL